jgi:hypothetical protein
MFEDYTVLFDIGGLTAGPPPYPTVSRDEF